VDLGLQLVNAAQEIEVELVRVVRVVSADDVHLGDRVGEVVLHLAERLLEVPRPALLLVPVGAVEPAELAIDRADIGRIEVHVADEVRRVAALALAHDVRQRPDQHELAGSGRARPRRRS
jgi:hypothetical protein